MLEGIGRHDSLPCVQLQRQSIVNGGHGYVAEQQWNKFVAGFLAHDTDLDDNFAID